MPIAVEMPKLGNTVEECLLAKWTKAKGDRVSEGDIIAEIETDKATFEVPAPASGTMLETFFEEGALVPVFVNICVIGEPGESTAEFGPKAVAPPLSDEPFPLADARGSVPIQNRDREGAEVPGGLASPRARRFAAERGINMSGIRGSGPGGRVLEQDVREAYHSAPRTSGLARRRIAEGYEPAANATGINGMLVAADLSEPGIALPRMRETIARRMRESLAATAQYTLTGSAGATGLLAIRRREKTRRPDVTINALVLFATVKALERIPELNGELKNGKLYRQRRIHLGFACDTDRGLMVPVIRNAEAMNLEALASAAKSLADAAVSGIVSPDDLAGATFTVSNLGALGIESFTPIINAPQVAILGVNSIELRPVRRDGRVEFEDRIGLSLTCDHQVIDGAPGARFLSVVRECIEKIELLSGLTA
jgi:pyruvate dehydrogenase E2 component (dihydrolipoamide acetyltransferase)